MAKVELTGEEIVTLGRLKAGGGNVASHGDPAKNCATYSRLWDLGYVEDLGTQQILTDAGLAAYRKAYREHVTSGE